MIIKEINVEIPDDSQELEILKQQIENMYADITFYYNKKTEKINNVHGKEEILELRNTYLFWEKWEDIKDYRVVSKNKKTILIFNYENKGTVLNYRYYFPTLSSNLPEKITEIINKRTTTSNSTASFNTYYFTENNRQINHRLPDKIVQALFESN